MRAVVQRVTRARVTVGVEEVGGIGAGLCVLLGVTHDDGDAQAVKMADKIWNLRVMDDEAGVMNRSVADVGGEVLAVSQFTLYASTRKGNRPSWSGAAPPEIAEAKFAAFVASLARELGKPVPTGRFGAYMHVALVNDGPVTIALDSKQRE